MDPIKKNSTWMLLIALLVITSDRTASGEVKLHTISAKQKIIDLYEKFEIDLKLDPGRDNPFDPKKISILGYFYLADGNIVEVPAFYCQDKDKWKIRYTPVDTGKISYEVRITREGSDGGPSKRSSFEVVHSFKHDGFIRKSRNNPYYMVFDSGRPFYGIGHNIGWVTDNDVSIFESYFADMRKAGCNLTRIWINCPWTPKVENEKIGRYDLVDCAKIDRIIELAQKYGIYVILVLDSYSSLKASGGVWNEASWDENPYNSKNGGFCSEPWDFFRDKNAKGAYRNRLRYIVSRWGYSPNIMAFELWNEVNIPEDWASEMMAYMKSINPHGQLMTTSLETLSRSEGGSSPASVWETPGNDLIQLHVYGNTTDDLSGFLLSTGKELAEKYKKAIFIGEFGMNSFKHDKVCDIKGTGVELHNSLWASVVSGSFSGSLNWWWAGYIRGKDLYHNYTALRNFVSGVDWNSHSVKLFGMYPVKKSAVRNRREYSDVVIGTAKNWGDTRFGEFIVHNNGDLEGGVVNYYLQGSSKEDYKIDPVFKVDLPARGKLVIDVEKVSLAARLTVDVDGKNILAREFVTGPGKGPWKKSEYLPEYNMYQCEYDAAVSVDVPAGKHEIKLGNTGVDWIGIKKLTFTGYMTDEFANARATGIAVGKDMIFWIQNRDYNWKNLNSGNKLSTVTGSYFDIKDVDPGIYELEWWDTSWGKVMNSAVLVSKADRLTVPIPDFSSDIACKIRRSDNFASTEPSKGVVQQ
ncbi:MAG: cellulase family glycosylhydrolase [Candidatus Omnitrophica bacterium]|nr:cellulase family glycosylhydrolase [Candidatus Omnitrophota bacterium]